MELICELYEGKDEAMKAQGFSDEEIEAAKEFLFAHRAWRFENIISGHPNRGYLSCVSPAVKALVLLIANDMATALMHETLETPLSLSRSLREAKADGE